MFKPLLQKPLFGYARCIKIPKPLSNQNAPLTFFDPVVERVLINDAEDLRRGCCIHNRAGKTRGHGGRGGQLTPPQFLALSGRKKFLSKGILFIFIFMYAPLPSPDFHIFRRLCINSGHFFFIFSYSFFSKTKKKRGFLITILSPFSFLQSYVSP